MSKTDISLDIDGIDPTDLPRIWSTMQAVAQGFALDGLDVTLRTMRQGDDGDFEETYQAVGPESEAQ